jgi:hypothetical protein
MDVCRVARCKRDPILWLVHMVGHCRDDREFELVSIMCTKRIKTH